MSKLGHFNYIFLIKRKETHSDTHNIYNYFGAMYQKLSLDTIL